MWLIIKGFLDLCIRVWPEPGKSAITPFPNSQPTAKKAGKQLDAKGFGRTQKLAITDTEDHFPPNCDVCDQSLPRECAQAYTDRLIHIIYTYFV